MTPTPEDLTAAADAVKAAEQKIRDAEDALVAAVRDVEQKANDVHNAQHAHRESIAYREAREYDLAQARLARATAQRALLDLVSPRPS